jgi:hypothetical protein
MSQLVNLQDDGFCNGLSDANKAIAKARNSTPENLRHLFRSVHREYPQAEISIGDSAQEG